MRMNLQIQLLSIMRFTMFKHLTFFSCCQRMVSPFAAVVWFTGLQMQTLPLKEYCAPLNKALLLNLTHQQQKTRVAALHAIGALVPVDPAILKDTLPSVAKLNLDRTHQLREQVSASIRCPRCCSLRH